MDKAKREQLRFLKMIKNECGEQLDLIKDYHIYTDGFYARHRDEINALEAKILENVKKSEVILEGFNLVHFIDKDNKLMLCIENNGRKVAFNIDSLGDIDGDVKDTKVTLRILRKFVREHKENLYRVVIDEQKLIEQMTNLKKDEPKKKFGFIVTQAEKDRVQHRYDKKLKELKFKLSGIYGSKKSIMFNIDVVEKQISDFKALNEFLKNLTPKQKKQIIDKYNQVNVLYQKNEVFYTKLNAIEADKLKLSEFVNKNTKEEAKWSMLPLLKILALLYKGIPEAERDSHLTSLTKVVDFGEYKPLIDTVLSAMEHKEFGDVSKSSLKRYGDLYAKKLAKREHDIKLGLEREKKKALEEAKEKGE